MIVDASALVAIAFEEADAASFHDALASAEQPLSISPINVWEVATRLNVQGDPDAIGNALGLLGDYGIEIAPVDVEMLDHAMTAQARYGKANHPARLNLGDCFAYALAKTRDEPLLFKGDDFRQTDITSVLA